MSAAQTSIDKGNESIELIKYLKPQWIEIEKGNRLYWFLCHPPHCEDNVSLKLTLGVTSCRKIHSRAKVYIDLWDYEYLQVLYSLIPINNFMFCLDEEI